MKLSQRIKELMYYNMNARVAVMHDDCGSGSVFIPKVKQMQHYKTKEVILCLDFGDALTPSEKDLSNDCDDWEDF